MTHLLFPDSLTDTVLTPSVLMDYLDTASPNTTHADKLRTANILADDLPKLLVDSINDDMAHILYTISNNLPAYVEVALSLQPNNKKLLEWYRQDTVHTLFNYNFNTNVVELILQDNTVEDYSTKFKPQVFVGISIDAFKMTPSAIETTINHAIANGSPYVNPFYVEQREIFIKPTVNPI